MKIFKGVEKIIESSGRPFDFIGLKEYLSLFFSGSLRPYDLSIDHLRERFGSAEKHVAGKEMHNYRSLRDAAVRMLERQGYRRLEDILTGQELRLECGTPDYPEHPYKPSGLVCGKLLPEEVSRARQLQRAFPVFGAFYSLAEDTVPASLEPLDHEGNTIRDPVPLNYDMKPVQRYAISADFPWPRQ